MTCTIWDFIKKKLIEPYLDIDLLYYNLSVQDRGVLAPDQTTRRGRYHHTQDRAP